MSASELKTVINQMLNQVDDERFLRTMFAMMSEYTGTGNIYLAPDQKKLIDNRKKSHQAGLSKSYSVKQMKELVLKNMK